MNFAEVITEDLFLNEAASNSLLLLDLDDTLLTAQNVFVYRTKEHPSGAAKLTPQQYAKEKVTASTKGFYDYKDFRTAETVGNSIITGIPIISNLKMMDSYIKNGWKIGILTARGMENVVFKSIKVFLKFKEAGELKDIGDKLVRELVFAINDDNKKYKGNTDFTRKKNVMLSLLDKYDRVWLLDDDLKNIKAINDLKTELKNKKDIRHGKLRAIFAKKKQEI